MGSLYRTTHWLVGPSLILSLALVGFSPQIMVQAETDSGQVAASPTATCCCGTSDGRCCGMGCCVMRQPPAKENSSQPDPRDARDGQNQIVAFAFAKAAADDGREVQDLRFWHSQSTADRSSAEASLQAKHVRIDA